MTIQILESVHRPVNNLNYKMISMVLKTRDIFYPPKYILKDVPILPDSRILDFGCGPGSYSIAAAELLRGKGHVFALDKNKNALSIIQNSAKKKRLSNITTICSECQTGLISNSIDVVFLYYLLKDLKNSKNVLHEIYRIMKPTGILSLSEYYFGDISENLEKTNLFRLVKQDEITHSFMKIT